MHTPLESAESADEKGREERSRCQWPLPLLLQRDPDPHLIDWDFTPQRPARPLNRSIKTVGLPPRFLGRRKELRDLKKRLQDGALRRLLITGSGGQGKTALAGKLALDLQGRGYEILAWRAGGDWDKFLFELELQLSEENTKTYDRMVIRCEDEAAKALLFLRLLLQQHRKGLVLFFDNLESLQGPKTRNLKEPRIQAWINAAQEFSDENLILLLTSRWKLPEWPKGEHWGLTHASYGDFLQMARQEAFFTPDFFRNRSRLRRVHAVLHGNGRGLKFFAAAAEKMHPKEEQDFLDALEQAEEETQTDMALDRVIDQLSGDELRLLQEFPAFYTPVPLEGVMELETEWDMKGALETLLAFSLIEKEFDPRWRVHQYHCSPLIAQWMKKREMPMPSRRSLERAAVYQLGLFKEKRRTLHQAFIVHQALQIAGAGDEADIFALDHIIGNLSQRGGYRTLLNDWLPNICNSKEKLTKGQALGQTGKQYLHLGDYDTALDYLKKSLAIRQEIGDRAGEGTTLNNISQIYDARGDYDMALDYLKKSLAIQQEIGDRAGEGTTLNNISAIYDASGDYDTAMEYLKKSLAIRQEIGDRAGLCATLFNMGHIFLQKEDLPQAMGAWVSVYRMAKAINLAQALEELENLAEQLKLPGEGLEAWETLARKMEEIKKD